MTLNLLRWVICLQLEVDADEADEHQPAELLAKGAELIYSAGGGGGG